MLIDTNSNSISNFLREVTMSAIIWYISKITLFINFHDTYGIEFPELYLGFLVLGKSKHFLWSSTRIGIGLILLWQITQMYILPLDKYLLPRTDQYKRPCLKLSLYIKKIASLAIAFYGHANALWHYV